MKPFISSRRVSSNACKCLWRGKIRRQRFDASGFWFRKVLRGHVSLDRLSLPLRSGEMLLISAIAGSGPPMTLRPDDRTESRDLLSSDRLSGPTADPPLVFTGCLHSAPLPRSSSSSTGASVDKWVLPRRSIRYLSGNNWKEGDCCLFSEKVKKGPNRYCIHHNSPSSTLHSDNPGNELLWEDLNIAPQNMVFHELQIAALCGLHCLNSLGQGNWWTKAELFDIANDLRRISGPNHASASGWFSVEVLEIDCSKQIRMVPVLVRQGWALGHRGWYYPGVDCLRSLTEPLACSA